MKALTILQPWASLIACGAKQIETRSWKTSYRGKIAIHAGQRREQWQRDIAFSDKVKQVVQFPLLGKYYGSVIAVADLVDCVQMIGCSDANGIVDAVDLQNGKTVTGDELAYGDYTLGRYAWILENVQQIAPVSARGMQRLWEWEVEGNV